MWEKSKEHLNNEFTDHRKHSNLESSHVGYISASNATEQQEEIEASTCEII